MCITQKNVHNHKTFRDSKTDMEGEISKFSIYAYKFKGPVAGSHKNLKVYYFEWIIQV